MASSLVKAGIAVAGVGSMGVGGLAISNYIKSMNNTVKSALLTQGYKLTSSLPTSEQNIAWAKVTNTYKLEKNQDLKIKEGEVTESDIRNWCKNHMEVQSNDSVLKKASKWCVVYYSFKDKLNEEKLAMETDEKALDGKYSSLGDLTEKVNAVTPVSGTGNENGRKLKKWCETMVYSSYKDNSEYQVFKGHCTKSAVQG
ncbi:hypothetical protein MHC_02315 [Mycoplasma haemocanis str. Illinois]|uniref:Uncharacterized protein n=1 Tax=Mycoplasma haemocanis (strain Illinois) TaxID=1111676 RepID=H6N6Q7_MYCHN|nr:hypothetical protein [Mycoplasma haemocanis]AEW45329.1 hypothetical protein MHC_02315 [Mycoplasma haemocanis str. Illinois]